MIKRIFYCEPLPLTALWAGLVLVVTGLFHLLAERSDALLSGLLPLGLTQSSWLLWLSSSALIFICSYTYRSLIIQSAALDFNERASLYPMALMLLPGLLSDSFSSGAIILIGLIMLSKRLIMLSDKEDGVSIALEMGVIIGLLIYLTPLNLILLLAVWIGITIVSNLHWRSFLATCIGLLLPLYLHASIAYIIGSELPALSDFSLQSITHDIDLEWWDLSFIVFMVALVISLVYRNLVALAKHIAKRRMLLRIAFLFFVFSLVLSGLFYNYSTINPLLSLSALPVSIFSLEMFRSSNYRIDSISFLTWFTLSLMLMFIAW